MKINIIHQVYDTLIKIHPETVYQYLGEYRFPRTSALGQTVFLKASASSSLCIWPKLLARLLCGHLHRTTVAVRVLLSGYNRVYVFLPRAEENDLPSHSPLHLSFSLDIAFLRTQLLDLINTSSYKLKK